MDCSSNLLSSVSDTANGIREIYLAVKEDLQTQLVNLAFDGWDDHDHREQLCGALAAVNELLDEDA